MIKSYYFKEFRYKGKVYKFKTPLKVRIEDFLCSDFKTVAGEMSIPSVLGGYTRKEPFGDNPEKDIKAYIKSVFDEFLTKPDNELDEYELKYKKDWLNLFKQPKK